MYITIACHSDIPDEVSIDITDNNIETQQTAHHLDRKKRDVDDDNKNKNNNDDDSNDDDKSEVVDTATDTITSDDYDDDGNESNVNSRNATNTKRTVRQLRPPPPPLGAWPFGDNFELPPEPRLHGSGARPHQQSSHFQRDTELSSVNYNTFLTPPGSGARSTNFFKNDDTSAAYYHQLPTSYNKQNDYNPYGNPYGNFKSPNPNTVTEYNTPKPYTVHTTFDIGDAQTQRFKPSKLVSQQPFYPLVSNNGTPKPAQSKLPQAAPAEDIDSLPENFSYYHMSNGVQIKQELSHHQQQQQQQPVQQVPKFPQPQPPVYYLDKPTKILSASTPKTHYVHVSTVGGFLNNNPSSFAAISQKKGKLRPNTEKYNEFTHRPLYRDSAIVHETNQNNNNVYSNTYNVQESPELSQYYNPLLSQRPTAATQIATSPKSVFSNNNNNELPFSNFDQNKSVKPLYSYEVTTDEIKPAEKNKGFYLTQTVKDSSAEKPLTRPSIKLPPPPPPSNDHKQQYDAPITIGQKKRPTFIDPQFGGGNYDYNKFVYDARDAIQNQKPPTPKYNAIARPLEPESAVIRAQNKPKPKQILTTTPNPDDYYYDVDEDESPTTTHRKPPQSSTTPKHAPSAFSEHSTKSGKSNFAGGFSRPSIISTPQSLQSTYKPNDVKLDDDEYYEEYDDDNDDDGDDTSDSKLPPQNVSKFMPMSETAAPRPYLTTVKTLPILTQRPLTTPSSTSTSKKHLSTLAFDRPLHSTKSSADTTTASVPAIIKFPDDDVFQNVRQSSSGSGSSSTDFADIPRYLNQSTLRPYTSRTRSKSIHSNGPIKPSKAPKVHIKTTSKTTSPNKLLHSTQTTVLTTTTTTPTTTTITTTPSTPKTKTFTIRAKHNNNNYNTAKGHHHQSQAQSQSQSTNNNSNRWRQEIKSQKPARTNALKKNLWELDERLPNRYHLCCNAILIKRSLPQKPKKNPSNHLNTSLKTYTYTYNYNYIHYS